MSLDQVRRYYSEKLAAHGTSPQGVDWNGPESQRLRFDQLLRVCEGREQFSIDDIGCGYGALFDYLEANRSIISGSISTPEMVAKAEELHRGRPGCRFLTGERADRVADFAVASGIFNVKLSAANAPWRSHVLETLETLSAGSRRGFSFNCLTRYSDAALMKDYLFYADPCDCSISARPASRKTWRCCTITACTSSPSWRGNREAAPIFGAGEIAEVAHFYFTHDAQRPVAAFTVDPAFVKEASFCGLPVLAFPEAQAAFAPGKHEFFVALRLRQDQCGCARRNPPPAEPRATAWRAISAARQPCGRALRLGRTASSSRTTPSSLSCTSATTGRCGAATISATMRRSAPTASSLRTW